MCLLCSLLDARGEGADEAIARDATLLAQVAQAAADLMRESAKAASSPHPGQANAEAIARDAYARAVQERA